MIKRITALLLAAVILITALPIQVFAYGGTAGSLGDPGISQTGDAGTGAQAGYRVSVQFVPVSGVKGYATEEGAVPAYKD